MSKERSPTLCLRARGRLACFTRPELKVERLSYEVPTPSAVRGLLQAILWKPAIDWHVQRIRVLSPIRFLSFRRNEVNTKATKPTRALVDEGGEMPRYYADEDRAQRNTVALRDVDYVFEAFMTLTKQAGPEDNMTKFVDMFKRRLANGQNFYQPYFGCREMAADVMPIGTDVPSPIDETRDLGVMLWDIEFGKKNVPRFFRARLEAGVLEVPSDPESTLYEVS